MESNCVSAPFNLSLSSFQENLRLFLHDGLGRVNTNHAICAILRAWKSPKRSTA